MFFLSQQASKADEPLENILDWEYDDDDEDLDWVPDEDPLPEDPV